MRILGLVFAGTATDRRPEMSRFVREFAVAGPRGAGETSRTIGLLVADLDAASAELRAAGIGAAEPATNHRQRYTHSTAPDGGLYELIEQLKAS